MIYSYTIKIGVEIYVVEFCYKTKTANFVDAFPELYGLGLQNTLVSTYPMDVGDTIDWGREKGEFIRAEQVSSFTKT
ncbi:hypothetical protein [Vibrio sp. McD22-P3]|uniref:hypothetical protein n=1 Tax=Vibrio sp. McD22-P3 TaxID=2724880 RepID=UPI001F35EB6E|nr:hypothetical protein [Vibrio sp. McD22-P3]MCF4173550.1 hypothetical protein [Vibrio sp. McD22-P3]